MPDIDIDISNKFKPSKQWIRASINNDGELTPHNSGYYTYDIPYINENNKLSIISYDTLDDAKINKVDFLRNSFYNKFTFQYEIDELIDVEIDWNILKDETIVTKVSHINNYFKKLQQFNIKSIEDMADFLALIRPGKSHLLDAYITDRESIRSVLYTPTNSYYYKKSHAYAYALQIKIQLVYYSRLGEQKCQHNG